MVRCKSCGQIIDHVRVNFFNHEGVDSYIPCEFKEYEKENAIELDVDRNWTGYELDDEERRETIRCPHCGKFPFDDEINIYEIVRVIMFKAEKKSDKKTPLEIALENENIKTCVRCEERVEVHGVSYCKVDGKILYPSLLEPPYSECPKEVRKRRNNQ